MALEPPKIISMSPDAQAEVSTVPPPPQVHGVDLVGRASLPRNPTTILHVWNNLINANVCKSVWNVLLIKEGSMLKCRFENHLKGIFKEGPIESKLPPETLAEALIERSEPIIEEDYQIAFSPRLLEWPLSGFIRGQMTTVHLLRGRKDFFWQLWNPALQTRVYVPLQASFASQRCSQYTKEVIQKISELTRNQPWQELTKLRCTQFTQLTLSELVKNHPRLIKDTFKSLNTYALVCKYDVESFQDGRIKFTIAHDGLPYKRPYHSGSRYEYRIDYSCYSFISKDLIPYFYEEGGKLKGVFITPKQARNEPWKWMDSHYSTQISHDKKKPIFTIALTPLNPSNSLSVNYKSQPGVVTFVTETRQFIEDEKLDDGDTPSYDRGCIMENVHLECMLSIPSDPRLKIPCATLTTVELEPRFACSYFDPTVAITQFRWGFTLITHGGSEGNHAEGVIEALNDGFFSDREKEAHVKFHFDFTGNEVRYAYRDEIKFEERSNVKYLDAENAKKMVLAIIKARENPPSRDLRGNNAIKSEGHSCFTWLREMAKIGGIELGESFWGFIATRTKNWTQPKSYYIGKPQNELL